MSIVVTPIPRLTNPTLLLPSGMIAQWSGLIANIPDGFTLCDGTAGTPDMRDRFVIGAADAVEPGSTGGGATHNHDAHVVTQPDVHAALATHAHNSVVTNGASGGYIGISPAQFGTGLDPGSGMREWNPNTGANVGTAYLTQAVSGGTPNAHSGSAVDAHTAANSEPPFFVLLFIMKT